MALIRWEPVRELSSLQHDINSIFDNFFEPRAGNGPSHRRWIPAMDLVESGDSYHLRVDLPGVEERDVKVELEDNTLTISGKRETRQEERKEGYLRVERGYGSFSRSLTLPEGVDPHQVKAHFENGVLEITVPKPKQQQAQRVEIDVSGSEEHKRTVEEDKER